MHLHSLQNRTEQIAKCSLFYMFLKLVEINLIYFDNLRILFISIVLGNFIIIRHDETKESTNVTKFLPCGLQHPTGVLLCEMNQIQNPKSERSGYGCIGECHASCRPKTTYEQ